MDSFLRAEFALERLRDRCDNCSDNTDRHLLGNFEITECAQHRTTSIENANSNHKINPSHNGKRARSGRKRQEK